jgi:aminopeptidase 2
MNDGTLIYILHSAAMGASRDAEVLQETLKIVTDKARDQDVIYFFQAMGGRSEGRRPLTTYFQDNYDAVSK